MSTSIGYLAKRFRNVLKEGPRKLNVLIGLAKACRYTDADIERAVGQLFILGLVQWQGRKRHRQLALNARG